MMILISINDYLAVVALLLRECHRNDKSNHKHIQSFCSHEDRHIAFEYSMVELRLNN